MSKLFYRPVDAWVGDNMPCYYDGKFYVYYQCDKRIPVPFPKGEPFGWSLAVSSDLIKFKDYGEVLHKGDKQGRERCLFAGSVINYNDKFYAFYTAENREWLGKPDLPPKEVFRIAVSDDGINWEKKTELTMEASAGFDKDYFRDPCVYMKEDGTFLLLICARKLNGPKIRSGVLLSYNSNDLLHWTYTGVFFDPEMYFFLQMPDLFKIGDWYYLFFSELDDQRRTRYRMSRSLSGPWIPPADDCLDGRCHYAARTIVANNKRYLFGWNPTRGNNDDLGMWIWGGNSVIHEVIQRSDGTLSVILPEIIKDRFIPSQKNYIHNIKLSNDDGSSSVIFDKDANEFFRLDFDFIADIGTFSFGVKIYQNSGEDCGYIYNFIPGECRVEFDKKPNYPWFRCMNRGLTRPVDNLSGVKHHCTLILDDDIAVMYVDDIALSSRMAEKPGKEISFCVYAGSISIENIEYFEDIK